MKTKFNNFFTILAAVITVMSTQANALWDADNLTLQDQTILIRKDIKGASNTHKLIDANTKKLEGISDLDGQSLEPGNPFIFDQIAVGYKRVADAVGLGDTLYNSAAPAALRNANIEIRQGGRLILREPVANAICESAVASPNEVFLQLNKEYHIIDDRNFDILLVFPEGSAGMVGIADNYEAFELRLRGMGAIAKQ